MFFSTLGEVAYNIIAPVFLVLGLTMLVDHFFDIDPRPLSRLVIYLFTPFLVFQRLATTDLQAGEAGKLVGAALLGSLLVAGAAILVARAVKFDRRTSSAFVLSVALINAANYGMPLNRFAFGEAGEERALIFFVGTVVISYTFGVFLASWGTVSARQALLNVFRVPLPYAVMAGLLVNLLGVELPTPISRSSELLASAAVPGMLVVLGLQLRRARLNGKLPPILLASGMRLIASPILALPLLLLMGMSGLTRQVAIVQFAMPTAVITGVLAAEFGADSEFVTATILVSTVLSMLTLSVLLVLVM